MNTLVQRRSAASRKARASQKLAAQARKLVLAALGGFEGSPGVGEGAGSSQRTTGGEASAHFRATSGGHGTELDN